MAVVVHVEAERDLDYLNNAVTDLEAKHGPLIRIGSDAASTLLTFEEGEAPTYFAKMVRAENEKSDMPSEADVIDRDEIFVEGELAPCVAYRLAF